MTYRGSVWATLSRMMMHRISTWQVRASKTIGITCFLSASLTPIHTSAQTTDLIECAGRVVRSLDFVNNTLQSGTANMPGSVYRYANVGDGVDAEVTLIGFTGGGALTIIDRDTGLTDNFQPEFAASNVSTARFTIKFFVAGTNTPIEIDFAASAIDVDGNRNAPTMVGLRELAEFENGFVESILNDTTELLTNASGPTLGFTRFQSETDQFAPGIDETAEDNIVTVFYTDVSEFDYVIGTVGNGNQNRLTSLGFNCPNLSNPISNPVMEEDFGDAPIIYGNPIHTRVNGIRLGASNTDDTGPFNSADASGDIGDDGITIPVLSGGTPATITTNVTGAGGFLQGWIDWNANSSFNDPGEQIAIDLQDTDGNGIIDIPITVPTNANMSTQTFARFRWSTSSGITTNTAVGDGEVEDYQLPLILPMPVADITAVKTVEVYDPASVGLYMTPGNEVIYKITVSNSDVATAEANDIDISDTLPSTVKFVSATTTGFIAGAFGTPDLPAPNTDCDGDACVIRYSGATLPIDTTGEITIRALIK